MRTEIIMSTSSFLKKKKKVFLFNWGMIIALQYCVVSAILFIYLFFCCECVCNIYIANIFAFLILSSDHVMIYLFIWLCSEEAMAPHSSTLAWQIPWTEEPGGLKSMGSLGVGHDWGTSLSLFTFMHWRRKWQPTPVFLSGESQGRGSLVGCRLWGHTESDMNEAT